MAMLNSEAYGDLANVSATSIKRQPGKFFPVFITGDVRPGQEYGKMQCMYEIKEKSEDTDYIIKNADKVLFIPYFVKRYWEKSVSVKGKDGKDYPKLVAFGWQDDIPKIDQDCKYAYIIAGVVLNSETKKAIQHTKDIEDAGIKKGDPVMVHFKCGGMKFNGAMSFLDKLETKAKSLVPLSNSPEFEKKIVSPRRFISVAKVSTAESKHGNKHVFCFDPEIQLPDKAVEQVMNSAVTLKSEFEKQFDKTALAKSGSTNTTVDNSDNIPFDTPASTAAPETEKTQKADVKDNNFDLGI